MDLGSFQRGGEREVGDFGVAAGGDGGIGLVDEVFIGPVLLLACDTDHLYPLGSGSIPIYRKPKD